MARTDPQVNLRFPADLKEAVDRAAKSAGRSMNAEIVARLQQSFEPQAGAGLSRSQHALLRLVVSFAQGPYAADELGGTEEEVERNRFVHKWLCEIRDDPSFDASAHLERFADFLAAKLIPRSTATHPRDWLVDQLLDGPPFQNPEPTGPKRSGRK